MTRPFSKVPGWLLAEKPGMTPLGVFAALGQHATQSGRAKVTLATLAEETGLAESTVRHAIARLRALGAVTCAERKFRQGPNEYRLHYDRPVAATQASPDRPPAAAPTVRERPHEKVPTEPQPEEEQDEVLATLAPPAASMLTRQSAPDDLPLDGMPSALPRPPNGGDLVRAWIGGWTKRRGHPPDDAVVRRVAGNCHQVAKTRNGPDSWQAAGQAAWAAGARGQYDVVAFMADYRPPPHERVNHDIALLRELAAAEVPGEVRVLGWSP